MKRIRHLLEFAALAFIEGLVRLLPLSFLMPLANGLGWFIYRVVGYRRKVALSNLAAAFPEQSAAVHDRTALQCCRHFSLSLIEFIKTSRWPAERVRDLIDIEYRGRGEPGELLDGPVIMVSGHLGNWELGLVVAGDICRGRASLIQQRQSNPYADRRSAELRRRRGFDIIYSRGAIRQGFAALSRGHMLAMLSDQDGGRRGVFVPFFGTPASTPPGPALLHLRSGAPLVFTYCVRVAPFQYKWVIQPLFHQPASDSPDQLADVTAAVISELERAVREYPEQYLWLHKRWKTRPETIHSGQADE